LQNSNSTVKMSNNRRWHAQRNRWDRRFKATK